MQTAASRLYVFLIIAAALIQSALPHIDHPITAAYLAQGIPSFSISPTPEGFLQDTSLHIQSSPLFQQLLSLFFTFGDYGLIALQAICLISIITLLLHFARPTKRRTTRLSSLHVLAITLLFIAYIRYWNLTPETTAIPFIIATTAFLIKHRRQADWLSFWPLFLIQTLWNYTNDWYWIGLTLITLFSAEMILRESFQIGRWSLLALQNWWPVILLSALTLILAPNTWKTSTHLLSLLISGQFHLYPLEIGTSPWINNPLFSFAAILLILLTVLNTFLHYGQTFWSLAILAFCFGWNTFSSDTYTTLFLLFTTLTLLSSSYLGSRISGIHNPQAHIISIILTTISLIILSTFLHTKLQPQSTLGYAYLWQQHNKNTHLIPKDAALWIKKHAPKTARILHQPHLSGHLIIHGLSPSQTTLTPLTLKYSPDTRRKAFLLSHRPTTLALFINEYKPDYILVDLSSYAWIPILRELEFRPVLATHNSTLWSQNPNHPTVDIAPPLYNFSHTSPIPTHHQLLRILTLAAANHTDLAWDLLQEMPPRTHRYANFSNTLNALSFHFNLLPPETFHAIQDWIKKLSHSQTLPWTQSWYALYHLRKTEYQQALNYAQNLSHPDTHTLIGQLHLALNNPEAALKSLQKNSPFSPFNPRHSLYIARAHIALGNRDQAAFAYQHAITYAPDDLHLRQEIDSFVKQHTYPTLRQVIQKIKETPLSIPPL